MTGRDVPLDEHADSFDQIALDLQTLRDDAGPVSYAELVRRITALRLDRGIHRAAAIPARSTVYNAFQTGRARIDTDLLRDIVMALGADTQEASAWVQRCRNARRSTAATARSRETRPDAIPAPPGSGSLAPRSLAALPVAGIVLACVALNLLGLYVTGVFKLSVYLDMVGTAIASIVLGPWHGVAVAVASNGLGFLTGDLHTLEFTPVNIVGALVWGYGIRRFRMGTVLSRYVALNVATALACSIVAAPIVTVVFFGGAGHASEQAVLSLQALDIPFVASVFSANIVTSVMDKLLTGFIALAVFTLLYSKLGIPANHMPLVEKLGALRTASAPTAHDRPGRLAARLRRVSSVSEQL